MYADNTSETKAVICTIPRSGTNLVEYFMRYLGFFLFAKQENWDSEEYIFNSVATNRNTHRQLFPKVGHGYCPGYRQLKSNIWYDKWSQIPESDQWFNVLRKYLEQDSSIDLSNNKNCKIVFVYRNVYDFILSLYDHLKNHKNFNLSNQTLDDFALTVVPQFIKSYVSFREMKANYSNRIFLVKYDDLILERKKYLWQICQFCGIDKNYDSFTQAFDKAYQYTDKNEMKRLEAFMGQTLAGDQNIYDPTNSHIRAVDRKSQRENLSPELVFKVQSMLNEYQIDDFR